LWGRPAHRLDTEARGSLLDFSKNDGGGRSTSYSLADAVAE